MLAIKEQNIVATNKIESFTPIRMVEIELGQSALPAISAFDEQSGRCYQRALCLVRLHTQPLGLIELTLTHNGLSAEVYLPLIWGSLGQHINAHLLYDGLSPITHLDTSGLLSLDPPRCMAEREQFLLNSPFVSIIVSTHDRPDFLATCLPSLLALHYPRYEVIVVDNAPSTTQTADLLRDYYPHVRYLCEPRRGISWARNCGVQAAKGTILAFTDDDVVVDSYWLAELVRPFSLYDRVACVSGLILPLELESSPQFWFEAYGGFTRGFSRRIFDLAEHRPSLPLYPYVAGHFGTGASMAFTAQFLHASGGFDPALGAGSPAQGGEDLAMFFQVIKSGHKLVYEPGALLYHLHRRKYGELLKQIHGNGVGLTAYFMKNIIDNPWLLFEFIAQVPYGLFLLLYNRYTKTTKTAQQAPSYPKELAITELRGMLYGYLAYLRGHWRLRHTRSTPV